MSYQLSALSNIGLKTSDLIGAFITVLRNGDGHHFTIEDMRKALGRSDITKECINRCMMALHSMIEYDPEHGNVFVVSFGEPDGWHFSFVGLPSLDALISFHHALQTLESEHGMPIIINNTNTNNNNNNNAPVEPPARKKWFDWAAGISSILGFWAFGWHEWHWWFFGL